VGLHGVHDSWFLRELEILKFSFDGKDRRRERRRERVKEGKDKKEGKKRMMETTV
jgi:hypothetical protein